jgi:hypothetical protein
MPVVKQFLPALLFFILFSMACNPGQKNHSGSTSTTTPKTNMNIQNKNLKDYKFLEGMYGDEYFPKFLVDKGKQILINLCLQIEQENPKTLKDLYVLTQASTEEFNALEDDFMENGSEIETAARECIAVDFEYIAKAYGFNPDIEELIATRNW